LNIIFCSISGAINQQGLKVDQGFNFCRVQVCFLSNGLWSLRLVRIKTGRQKNISLTQSHEIEIKIDAHFKLPVV